MKGGALGRTSSLKTVACRSHGDMIDARLWRACAPKYPPPTIPHARLRCDCALDCPPHTISHARLLGICALVRFRLRYMYQSADCNTYPSQFIPTVAVFRVACCVFAVMPTVYSTLRSSPPLANPRPESAHAPPEGVAGDVPTQTRYDASHTATTRLPRYETLGPCTALFCLFVIVPLIAVALGP